MESWRIGIHGERFTVGRSSCTHGLGFAHGLGAVAGEARRRFGLGGGSSGGVSVCKIYCISGKDGTKGAGEKAKSISHAGTALQLRSGQAPSAGGRAT